MKVTRDVVAQICKDCQSKGLKDVFYDVDMHIVDVLNEVKKLERADDVEDTAEFNAGVMKYIIEEQVDPDYAVVFFSDLSNNFDK